MAASGKTMGEAHQFGNIALSAKGRSRGQLVLRESGLTWKSKDTATKESLKAPTLEKAMWSQRGRSCSLKVYLKDERSIRFDGFKSADQRSVAAFFTKHFGVEVSTAPVCVKGLNWGDVEFESDTLLLKTGGGEQTIMEVPLASINQVAAPGKNEVEVQFLEVDTGQRQDEQLTQMRLFVPGSAGDGTSSAAAAAAVAPSAALQAAIVKAAGIESVTGDSVVELSDKVGTFLTPRGRYGLELYGTFLRMHGKTYAYSIMYKSISRLFLLPRPDGRVAFVISLDDPIRQGNQRYAHLVMQVERKEAEVSINLSEEELQKRYAGKLAPVVGGELPDVVAKVFKVITGKKVFIPGRFRSKKDQAAVKAALKASEGFLYLLERSFFFIHKPATFLRFEDTSWVEFHRYQGSKGAGISQTFDLQVSMRSVGREPPKEYTFTSIDRQEYAALFGFLNKKKIRIKNIRAPDTGRSAPASYAEGGDSDSDDDSDFDGDAPPPSSSSDDDFSGAGSDGDGSDGSDDDSDGSDGGGGKRKAGSSGSGGRRKKARQ